MKQLFYILTGLGLLFNTSNISGQEKENEDKKSKKTFQVSMGINDNDTLVHKNDDEDTITFNLGDRTVIIFKNKMYIGKNDSNGVCIDEKSLGSRWAGFDIGVNGFMNSSGSMDLSHGNLVNPRNTTNYMEVDYKHSWMVRLNFLEMNLRTKNERFGLLTGLGLEWNNYELKNNVRLIYNGGHFVDNSVSPYSENYTWGEVDTINSYSKNRFKTFTLNVPLLAEINFGKEKEYYVTAGAILGFNIRSKMKYKYSGRKEKSKGDFNVNPLRASLTAKIGNENFGIFATYGLSSMFEKNKGPEVYPISFGVTLINF